MFTQKKIRIGLQGILAFIFVMVALANLSGAATPEVERLGYPRYFSFLLGPACIIGVICLYQKKYSFLQEWALGGFAANLVGASTSHILAGDPIAQALPSFAIQALFIWFYILRLREKNEPQPVEEVLSGS